ncbi:hypothetical protein RND81_08G158800 [Saponaria officinalis]|uniref:Uncharacterized protein n=1 Tax=Saponaria officinalis TaxID=3572 RepID=A0AAW1J7X9_SAPOF
MIRFFYIGMAQNLTYTSPLCLPKFDLANCYNVLKILKDPLFLDVLIYLFHKMWSYLVFGLITELQKNGKEGRYLLKYQNQLIEMLCLVFMLVLLFGVTNAVSVSILLQPLVLTCVRLYPH